MFTAALFTIAKTWKQPKCPSTDDWLKKTWHIYIIWHINIYNGILAIKNEILPFVATEMDLKNIILSEVRQRKTNTI